MAGSNLVAATGELSGHEIATLAAQARTSLMLLGQYCGAATVDGAAVERVCMMMATLISDFGVPTPR